MTFPFDLPRDASPRLRGLQILQLSVAGFTILATFLAAVVPHKTKPLTFSLLYGLILTSLTTTFLVRREQQAAKAGALSKDKYAKYQLYKMVAAVILSVIAFFAGSFTTFVNNKDRNQELKPGENGMLIGGYRVNTFHSIIMGVQALNWLFLWASLFYSCCMSGKKQGVIRLGDEETAPQEYQDETVNDEALARRLQSEDPNWQ